MINRMILNETSYFGPGARKSIPDEVKKRGFKKAFLVTDKDLMKFGVATMVIDVLKEANLSYEVFDNIKQNPTVQNVKDGVKAFKDSGADYIISVGGGSSIDTAKAIGMIIANPEFSDVVSLEGVADTKNKSVPHIAVATTAGTAAEVTINYVITDVENKRKFVCVDPGDIPVVAIVDPELMASMPKNLAAATGMDALTHAIEGYITKGAWSLTDTLTLKSIEMIANSLKKACDGDLEAKNDMGIAQYVAGMAFSNVGLGIVHSMAHPLGAFYDTPHGIANALLLPYVMEYNADSTGEKYMHIAKAFGVENACTMSPSDYRTAAVNAVRELAISLSIPQKLSEIGVRESDLESLSEAAFKDVCTGGNPKETSVEEILSIYKTAF